MHRANEVARTSQHSEPGQEGALGRGNDSTLIQSKWPGHRSIASLARKVHWACVATIAP